MKGKNNNPSPGKYRFLLLICLGAVLVFCFPGPTRAAFAPAITVTDFKINGVIGNEIKGEVTVSNNEDYYLTGLDYELKLFQGDSFDDYKPVDVALQKESFFIPPKTAVVKSFDYFYPQNIITGDYSLMAQVVARGIGELGWKSAPVALKGQNKFLEMFPAQSRVLAGGKEYWTMEGANIAPAEAVTAVFTVKNPGNEISVTPDVKIFKRQIDMGLAKEYRDAPITIGKGETKKISLQMPKFDAPESYLAQVRLYQGQEQVSGIENFRWVVKGQGGKILDIKSAKDYFKAGDTMELAIESVGPADATDLGQGKLEITVYNNGGNAVASVSKDVPINSDSVSSEIKIPIAKDLVAPGIKASLVKDGKILDESTISLPVFSAEAKQLQADISKKGKAVEYLFYSLLAVIILIAGFLIYRAKGKKIEPFFAKIWKAGKK
jgi:hypothetical protein